MTYRYPQSTQMCVATAVSSARRRRAFARRLGVSLRRTAGSAHATGGDRGVCRAALAPFGRLSPLPTPPKRRPEPAEDEDAREDDTAGRSSREARADREDRSIGATESRDAGRSSPASREAHPGRPHRQRDGAIGIAGARLPFARHLRQSKSRLGFRDLGRRRLKRSVFVVPSKPSLSTTLLLVSRRSQRAPVKRST